MCSHGICLHSLLGKCSAQKIIAPSQHCDYVFFNVLPPRRFLSGALRVGDRSTPRKGIGMFTGVSFHDLASLVSFWW